MNKFKASSLILCFCLIFSLTSCGYQMTEDIKKENLINAKTTENDISSEEFVLMAQSDSIEFWMNPDTTHFKVVDIATGKEWFSYNKAEKQSSVSQAILNLKYLNETNGFSEMNTTADSVVKGQYKIQRNDNGVTVSYSLGSFSTPYVYPEALSEERYEALCKAIEDEFDLGVFESSYININIENIEDETQKNELLTNYPKLSEMPLYVLSVKSEAVYRKLSELLERNGYTEEDYEFDQQFAVKSENTEKEASFCLDIVYELEDNQLKVTVPNKSVQMYSEFPLLSIGLFGYFGSPLRDEDGYFVLPNNSGSVMNFYNGKGNLQPISFFVYGDDESLNNTEKIHKQPAVYIPFYGINRGDSAVVVQITKGAELCELNAFTGNETQSAYVNTEFFMRNSFSSSYKGGASEAYNVIQKKRCESDLSYCMTFLSGENTDYNSMAKVLRKNIWGEAKVELPQQSPILAHIVGAVKQNEGNTLTQLTSYSEVAAIAEELSSLADNLAVKLSGWYSGGYYGTFSSKTPKAIKELGGEKEFKKLSTVFKEKNIALYLDSDVQHIYETGFNDGVSVNDHIAFQITRSKARLYAFDYATFIRQKPVAYIANISGIKAGINGLKKSLIKYAVEGMSLRNIGSILNSNFDEEAFESRTEAIAQTQKILSELKKDNISLLTSGVNDYVMNYADIVCDLPFIEKDFEMLDSSVPIIQMVISGMLQYTGIEFNAADNIDVFLAKSALSGAGLQVTYNEASPDALKASQLESLFASNYSYYKETYNGIISGYLEKTAAVAGRELIRYSALTDNVGLSVFDNGKAVIANFSNASYSYNGTQVAPNSFEIVEVQK